MQNVKQTLLDVNALKTNTLSDIINIVYVPMFLHFCLSSPSLHYLSQDYLLARVHLSFNQLILQEHLYLVHPEVFNQLYYLHVHMLTTTKINKNYS